jgi:hypothetical protein
MGGELIMLVLFVCALEVPVFWESKLFHYHSQIIFLVFFLWEMEFVVRHNTFFYESDNVSFNHSANFLKKTGGVWILT